MKVDCQVNFVAFEDQDDDDELLSGDYELVFADGAAKLTLDCEMADWLMDIIEDIHSKDEWPDHDGREALQVRRSHDMTSMHISVISAHRSQCGVVDVEFVSPLDQLSLMREQLLDTLSQLPC